MKITTSISDWNDFLGLGAPTGAPSTGPATQPPPAPASAPESIHDYECGTCAFIRHARRGARGWNRCPSCSVIFTTAETDSQEVIHKSVVVAEPPSTPPAPSDPPTIIPNQTGD